MRALRTRSTRDRRNPDGSLCPERFAESSASDQVKMIGLKLSQGAKPGHGGVLPGAKVNAAIAVARRVPIGEDCISPATDSISVWACSRI